jgi:FeS assembly SUF system regulator
MTHISGSSEGMRTAAAAAASTHVPEPTAGKILKALSRHGLLVSQRGINGGYTLARTPEEITITDIIAAVDGPIALTECLEADGGACVLETSCPTRGNWRKINAAIKQALDGITLADMTEPVSPFAFPPGAGDRDRALAQAERLFPDISRR